jgi:hypothetical protein
VGFSRLWRSKAKPAACAAILPDIYSLVSDQMGRGGYLITEDPQAPVMILTVPLPKNDRAGDSQHMGVSVPSQCCRLASSISLAALGSSRAR